MMADHKVIRVDISKIPQGDVVPYMKGFMDGLEAAQKSVPAKERFYAQFGQLGRKIEA